jgi:hypothetical protein
MNGNKDIDEIKNIIDPYFFETIDIDNEDIDGKRNNIEIRNNTDISHVKFSANNNNNYIIQIIAVLCFVMFLFGRGYIKGGGENLKILKKSSKNCETSQGYTCTHFIR